MHRRRWTSGIIDNHQLDLSSSVKVCCNIVWGQYVTSGCTKIYIQKCACVMRCSNWKQSITILMIVVWSHDYCMLEDAWKYQHVDRYIHNSNMFWYVYQCHHDAVDKKGSTTTFIWWPFLGGTSNLRKPIGNMRRRSPSSLNLCHPCWNLHVPFKRNHLMKEISPSNHQFSGDMIWYPPGN